MKATQLDLLNQPIFRWQWHGRQVFTELRNDPRFKRKLHRVVYHLADTCKATDERNARAQFAEHYPGAKETGLLCLGAVKKETD